MMVWRSLFGGLIVGLVIAAIMYFFFLSDDLKKSEIEFRVLGTAHAADVIGPAPSLSFPVACTIGEDCWCMAFMDLDIRATYHDHMCGVRTYDAHKGTDIAPNQKLVKTLDILAAAPGRVLGTRDGLDDSPMQSEDPARVNMECGNGVRLDHGNGWTTPYCHMQKGSVAVAKGAVIKVGEKLGRIGSSGWSELPHLHFQLEKDGEPIDPFLGDGPSEGGECTASRGLSTGLWQDAADHNADSYQPVYIRSVGLTTEAPTGKQVKFGGYPGIANPDAGALVAYVVLFGAPEGTVINTRIEGPAGQTVHTATETLSRDFAEYFSFSGKKRRNQDWPSGLYTARIEVSGTGTTGPYEFRSQADLILR